MHGSLLFDALVQQVETSGLVLLEVPVLQVCEPLLSLVDGEVLSMDGGQVRGSLKLLSEVVSGRLKGVFHIYEILIQKITI